MDLQPEHSYYASTFDISRLPLAWDDVSEEDVARLLVIVNSSTVDDFKADNVDLTIKLPVTDDGASTDGGAPEQ